MTVDTLIALKIPKFFGGFVLENEPNFGGVTGMFSLKNGFVSRKRSHWGDATVTSLPPSLGAAVGTLRASGPLALQFRWLAAKADCKLTSVDKWRQGMRCAARLRKISGVSRRLVARAKFSCIYNDFSVLCLLASDPKRVVSAIPARAVL